MPLNPDDPRVRKTRRGLQDALVRLILRQGYDSISIHDIAAEADTARVTFYRHYRDKAELLTDCLNTLYEDLIRATNRLSPEGLRNGYSPVLTLYRHIEEHEALYRILFSSQGTQTVMERLRHHLATTALNALSEFNGGSGPKVPNELIAFHAASAQIGLAVWWLDHGKPYPAEYMAQASLWLSLSGVLEAIGAAGFRPPAPALPTGARG